MQMNTKVEEGLASAIVVPHLNLIGKRGAFELGHQRMQSMSNFVHTDMFIPIEFSCEWERVVPIEQSTTIDAPTGVGIDGIFFEKERDFIAAIEKVTAFRLFTISSAGKDTQ